MKTDRVREVLKGGRFAAGEETRDRVIAIARRDVTARAAPLRSARRSWTVATAGLLLCLGLASVTPPGQAATQWVSDLVSGPNDFEPGQYGYQLQTSTLIGSGELSNGDRYQLRGYVGNGSDGGCVAVVWENSDKSAAMCENNSPVWKDAQISAPIIAGLPNDKSPGASGTYVFGVASEQTSEVQLRVPASDGVQASNESAQLFPIAGSISDTGGASASIPPVKLFVGYLPSGAGDIRRAPPAEAAALSSQKDLAAVKLSWIRFQRPDVDESSILPCLEGDDACQTILRADGGTGSP
jgi:hypothetical protein